MRECKELKIKFGLKQLAIKQLLSEKIWELLTCLKIEKSKIIEIPLYRLKNETKIIYRTSIVTQIFFTKEKELDELVNNLKKSRYQEKKIDFEVKINDKGEMDFEISDRFLDMWLQNLLEISRNWEQEIRKEVNEFTADIFPSQYAHARCCALLRLGEEERIIKLKKGEFSLVEPSKIAWLLLREPTERKLINQLITVVDALNSPESVNWVKQGNNLSIAVLEFYSSCRIWGEIRQKTPELSLARLGVISLAQKLLFCLIQEQLRVSAITEF